MAEFCLECYKKINGKAVEGKEYIISKDLDLCEGCGQWKPVVVAERQAYYGYVSMYLTFPFKVIGIIIHILFRLIMLPYFIIKYVILR